MNPHKTQLERVRTKLLRDGYVTRNECLSQFPAITRLGARIRDLEVKEGFEFRAEWKGGDYCYTLLSINGVPFVRPDDRAENLRHAAQLVREFESYQPR